MGGIACIKVSSNKQLGGSQFCTGENAADTNQDVHLTLEKTRVWVAAALFSCKGVEIQICTRSSGTFSAQGLSWSSCVLIFNLSSPVATRNTCLGIWET